MAALPLHDRSPERPSESSPAATPRGGPAPGDGAATARLAALHVYPVKSCAGLAPARAPLVETGLDLDRAWMVADADGRMLTQREHPRLALVQPALRHADLLLRAPGMLALHLALDAVDAPARARVFDDEVAAYTMGPLAAQWFTDFLGRPAQLLRFDPEQRRLADPAWTGTVEAETSFVDGYPLTVAGSASLADLNARLVAAGHAPVDMRRFRPNLVLDGLQPWDEDHLREIEIEAADGAVVVLRLVQPCVRCTIPDVDPATGDTGHEPGRTLAGFRSDRRVGGGITFGTNAVIVSGLGATLAAPARVTRLEWGF